MMLLNSCTWDKKEIPPNYQGYPADIGKIMLTQCATKGCHDRVSKDAAAGLSLETYSDLFKGSRNNAAVVPYRADQSFLSFFINTYDDLGPVISPSMPYNQTPMSRKDVLAFMEWINNGAPDSKGGIMFSGDPDREKVYISNQGCDLVTVLDKETNLIMRYIDVGESGAIESPHMLKVSPDNAYWYTIFSAGNTLQKYDASTDSLVGSVNIGSGSWNTFAISSDGSMAYIVNWDAEGSIVVVDLNALTLLQTYQGGGLLVWPHGSMLSPDDQSLYVTAQTGNYIYKIDVSDPQNPEFEEVSLETGIAPSAISKLDPHEIVFSPDGLHYYVSCQNTDEVRVMQASNDSLIAIIPVGGFPQEFSISKNTDYLFVSCTEDVSSFPGKVGAVTVINYKNHSFVKTLYTGYQPHGLQVDDEQGIVYVANRNASTNGPAPHHATDCEGRNGYLTLINISTLELMDNFRAELSVDPYSITIRQ